MEIAGRAPLTYALVGANIAIFILTFIGIGPAVTDPRFRGVAPLIVQFGVLVPAVQHGEVWRLLTAGFLHFDIAHVSFNMLALYQVGLYCEPRFGTPRFAAIYVSALLGGDVAALLTSGPSTVTAGASGAVMGAFGAMAAHAIRHHHAEALRGAAIPIAFTLVNGLTRAGISNAAHVGGLVAGVIVAAVLRAPRFGADLNERPAEESWSGDASKTPRSDL